MSPLPCHGRLLTEEYACPPGSHIIEPIRIRRSEQRDRHNLNQQNGTPPAALEACRGRRIDSALSFLLFRLRWCRRRGGLPLNRGAKPTTAGGWAHRRPWRPEFPVERPKLVTGYYTVAVCIHLVEHLVGIGPETGTPSTQSALWPGTVPPATRAALHPALPTSRATAVTKASPLRRPIGARTLLWSGLRAGAAAPPVRAATIPTAR